MRQAIEINRQVHELARAGRAYRREEIAAWSIFAFISLLGLVSQALEITVFATVLAIGAAFPMLVIARDMRRQRRRVEDELALLLGAKRLGVPRARLVRDRHTPGGQP